MSGGHSEVVPRLPIPNRTVKRLSADDSADSCVKVGHRQTPPLLSESKIRTRKEPQALRAWGFLHSGANNTALGQLNPPGPPLPKGARGRLPLATSTKPNPVT